MSAIEIVSLIATLVTIVVAVPTFGSWIEARRQRGQISNNQTAEHEKLYIDASPADNDVWICGIFDYPPLSIFNPILPSKASGPLVSILEKINDDLKIKMKFVPFSYTDFYEGKIPDISVGLFETVKRSERVSFTRPLYQIGLQGICRIGQQGDVLEQIRDSGLKVAVYLGEVGWEFVKEELSEIELEQRVGVFAGGHQMHTMILLKQGIYDVLLMDEVSCIRILRSENNSSHFKLAFDSAIELYHVGFALNKRHKHLILKINQIIEKNRNLKSFIDAEATSLDTFETIIRRRGLKGSN